jgi:hypothetical protein
VTALPSEREYPVCNWRVVFGPSGLWGLDCDVPGPDHAADGVAAMRELVAKHGNLPTRPMLRSGGGGVVLFFRHSGEPISGRTGTPIAGIDPRRGRLSQTIPPSRHHRTVQPYRWLIAPWEVPPPPAPDWLLALVAPPPPRPVGTLKFPQTGTGGTKSQKYCLAALYSAAECVRSAQKGSRNHTLNLQVFSLARLIGPNLAASEIMEVLGIAARQAGLDGREIRDTLQSALRAGGAS